MTALAVAVVSQGKKARYFNQAIIIIIELSASVYPHHRPPNIEQIPVIPLHPPSFFLSMPILTRSNRARIQNSKDK
jgi:hypothetical protein